MKILIIRKNNCKAEIIALYIDIRDDIGNIVSVAEIAAGFRI